MYNLTALIAQMTSVPGYKKFFFALLCTILPYILSVLSAGFLRTEGTDMGCTLTMIT